MNIGNIYNFTSDILIDNNVYYMCESKKVGITNNLLGIKENKILKYTNEWLHLINNAYYPHVINQYQSIVELYKKINNNKNNHIKIKDKVIPFITSFSYGTVHGYAGFFCILFEYLRNKEKYKDYKILVLENTQNGIKEIINNALNKKIIDKEKIIYIKPDIIYLIDKLLIIPNKYHNIMSTKMDQEIFEYVKKYISPMRNLQNYKRFNLSENLDYVCIIKTNSSNNTNSPGSYKNEDLLRFSRNNNVRILEPGNIHEIGIMLAINSCKIFICSWGTSFMKNYCYISEKCKKIIVVINPEKYLVEYNRQIEGRGLVKKFNNASIVYKIRDNLDFNFVN